MQTFTDILWEKFRCPKYRGPKSNRQEIVLGRLFTIINVIVCSRNVFLNYFGILIPNHFRNANIPTKF